MKEWSKGMQLILYPFTIAPRTKLFEWPSYTTICILLLPNSSNIIEKNILMRIPLFLYEMYMVKKKREFLKSDLEKRSVKQLHVCQWVQWTSPVCKPICVYISDPKVLLSVLFSRYTRGRILQQEVNYFNS